MAVLIDNPEYQVIDHAHDGINDQQMVFKAGSKLANQDTLVGKAQAALTANATSLAAAAIPAGAALTTTQLTTVVRALRLQVDALTRQNNALIKFLLNDFSSTADT